MEAIRYEHWTAMDNDWFKDNRFFQEAELSDRWVMLTLLTNIIFKPDKKYRNYSTLVDLLRRGFLPTNISWDTISDKSGLHRQTIYNARDRLIERGAIIRIKTEHLQNDISIVGMDDQKYGKFLFIEADKMKFGDHLDKDTIKFMNDKYMELDFFNRKNADNKTFIEALYPSFIHKFNISKPIRSTMLADQIDTDEPILST